jgi:hypothetical protein
MAKSIELHGTETEEFGDFTEVDEAISELNAAGKGAADRRRQGQRALAAKQKLPDRLETRSKREARLATEKLNHLGV